MKLNAAQEAAAYYNGAAQHILVNAGAGTGKTRTLMERIQFLIRSGTDAERILAITFTRRACNEMSERLAASIGNTSLRLNISTFHSFCLILMQKAPRAFGLERCVVLDIEDQLSLMKLCRGAIVKNAARDFPNAGGLVKMLSYATNTLMDVNDYLKELSSLSQSHITQAKAIYHHYEQRKKQSSYLDYDDLLLIFLDGLNRNPPLREKVQSLFDEILVDELQDTNPLQFQILKHITHGCRSFQVGDYAQSIYAFRGADYRNVESFSTRQSNTVEFTLDENYRSNQEILDLSNWVLSQSSIRYNMFLHAFRNRSGTKPHLLDFNTPYEEASFIASDILSRQRLGDNWSDHMVLVRTSRHGNPVQAALTKLNIPFVVIGGRSFLAQSHIRDILALARAATDYQDQLAWSRYLTIWPLIGDATAHKVVSKVCSVSDYGERLNVLRETTNNREEIIQGIVCVSDRATKPGAAIQAAVDHLTPVLTAKYDNWPSRTQDFKLLVELASKCSSIGEFINRYTLDPQTSSQLSKEDDVVQIITVHSAKGTEAKTVYMNQVAPGVYPHQLSVGNNEAIEEERRIFYVGITRAKDELFLSRCQQEGEPYFLSNIAGSFFMDRSKN